MLEVINPATGKKISTYKEMTPENVKKVIADSHETYLEWRKTSFSHRKELMGKAAEFLRARSRDYAKLMTLEMGKPIKQACAEIEKCAWVCDYYADNAEAFLQNEIIETDATKSFVTFQPIGVVLAVMPWNFPFWQVFRFAGPGLMGGNAGILKHASNVPGCALAIEEIFAAAGFPENLFRTLLVGSPQVEAIIENPLVKAVTLTGSTPAGRAVARKSGDMLKKTVLELGGSDPYIILADANLEETVPACAAGRLLNGGQSCIAAKRFIVVESIKEPFEQMLVETMRSYKMGDPLEEDTQIGPQARHDLRDDLHRQVKKSVEMGATSLLGCEIPHGNGAFYPPSVLTNVKKGMPAYDEELFGPVAAIISAKDEADAIEIANDTVFGLGAAVFTNDLEKGEHMAERELQAGACFVNSFVKSDPRLPFGGIKESGYGRELAAYGIREFVNIKTVYVK